MSTNALVTSFRYPANVPDEAAHPSVVKAVNQHTKGINDLNQAIVSLKSQIDAKTATTTFSAATVATSPVNTTVIPGNAPAVSSEWINSYDSSSGVFGQSQPAFSDISGQITTAQLPSTGLSVTIVTAALTVGGTQGSQTFTDGILTAQTPAT